MHIFIIIYSVTFIFLFAGTFSFKIFKLLRNPLYFRLILVISLFLTILFLFIIDLKNKDHLIRLFLISYTIIYLGIYKIIDNFCLKNYQRHLIFAPQYNYPFDEEHAQQSLSEILLQLFILILPFLLMYFLDKYL